jgi:hypothetical protein
MTPQSRPVAGDIGTEFRITCKDEAGAVVDLTSLASARILFTRPDGSIFAKAASVAAPPTAGIVRATWASGDCRVTDDGIWTVQAELTFAASLIFSTLPQRLQVAIKSTITE